MRHVANVTEFPKVTELVSNETSSDLHPSFLWHRDCIELAASKRMGNKLAYMCGYERDRETAYNYGSYRQDHLTFLEGRQPNRACVSAS